MRHVRFYLFSFLKNNEMHALICAYLTLLRRKFEIAIILLIATII